MDNDKTPSMASPFVGVAEVAEYLGMSRDFVYEKSDPQRTADFIPHIRLGKKIKYLLHSPEMQAWVSRQFTQQPKTGG